MKFDEDLTAVHAYLCSDGYVSSNKERQIHKYYYIGFRNTNNLLLKDFQNRFENYFGVKPRLIENERCIVQNKNIYEKLIKKFVSFYSKEWQVPRINKNLSKIWLRAFFDCEGWVFCKSHQNRHIGLDSINENGLDNVRILLKDLGISSIKKENKSRKIFRILIYGKENLMKFQERIGFLHPNKKEKLNEVIKDYIDYKWEINDKASIKKIMLKKAKVKRPHIIRIVSREEVNLLNLSKKLKKYFVIESIKVNKRKNGDGIYYFELSVNKKSEVKKLAKARLISDEQLNKLDKTKFKN